MDVAALTLYDHVLRYENGRLVEIPGPDVSLQPAAPAPVEVRFAPDLVSRGDRYEVALAEYAAETIDLAFDLQVRQAAYADVVRKWCSLDGSGRVTVVPADHPAATVQLEKIRSQHNA